MIGQTNRQKDRDYYNFIYLNILLLTKGEGQLYKLKMMYTLVQVEYNNKYILMRAA